MAMANNTRYHRHNKGLIWFFAGHLVVGLIAGEGLLAGLLLTNLGDLRTLIWGSSDKGIALTLLIIFFAITFGSLAMGSGVMGLRNRKEENKQEKTPQSQDIK